MNSKPIDYIALTIAIVGTLNWGLIGFLNFNLVHFIFRSVMVDRIISVSYTHLTLPTKLEV